MAKNKIIAKDCMPFYINGKEKLENAIDIKDIKRNAILAGLADMHVHIPIGNNRYMDDDDSKIAYSPYETGPFFFSEEVPARRVWQAGRYVGEVVIGDTTISVEPRFGTECLSAMIGELLHFRLLKSDEDNNKDKSTPWSELIKVITRYLWLQKFANADRYGLPRKTVKKEHLGLQILGHLNVRKSIIPLFTKRQVVSEYREKEVDETIGKIVYKAYSILAKGGFSKGIIPTQIQDSLNSLYTEFHGKGISVSVHDYNRIQYKSIYQSWKPLVDYSWQIILQNTFSLKHSQNGAGYCLFLDMAEIWEAYLRKQLGDILKEKGGWNTVPQFDCETKVYQNQFYKRIIIPDLLFYREKEGKTQYIVLDAKYKRMRGKKEDVDRADFFQIHSYIQYYSNLENSEVVLGGLLYPLEEEPEDRDGWHSDSLFGIGQSSTRLIVDGICLNSNYESMNDSEIKKDLSSRITTMIDKWGVGN